MELTTETIKPILIETTEPIFGGIFEPIPKEIMRLIFQFLQPTCQIKFTMVCKKFSKMYITSLYNSRSFFPLLYESERDVLTQAKYKHLERLPRWSGVNAYEIFLKEHRGKNLRHLYLNDMNTITQDQYNSLQRASKLEILEVQPGFSIVNTRITTLLLNANCIDDKTIAQLTNLVCLHLPYYWEQSCGFLKELPSLSDLIIRSAITYDDFPVMTQLTSLKTDMLILKSTPNLQKLTYGYGKDTDFRIMTHLTGLTHLAVYDTTSLGSAKKSDCSPLSVLTSLVSLNLSQITNSVCHNIPSFITKLRSGCGIDNEIVSSLVNLRYHQTKVRYVVPSEHMTALTKLVCGSSSSRLPLSLRTLVIGEFDRVNLSHLTNLTDLTVNFEKSVDLYYLQKLPLIRLDISNFKMQNDLPIIPTLSTIICRKGSLHHLNTICQSNKSILHVYDCWGRSLVFPEQ